MEPIEHQQNIKPEEPQGSEQKAGTSYEKAVEEQDKKEAKNSIKQIHTFQSDVANAIKKDNVSVIKIALAEKRRQEKRGYEEENVSPKSRKNIVIILASVFLVILSFGIIGYFYYRNEVTSTPKIVPVVHDLIFSESKENVPVDNLGRNPLINAINTERDAPISLGAIKSLVFTR